MDHNIIQMTRKRLANLFFLSEEEIQQLLDKHHLFEERKRNFFWIPFLWICFRCILNKKTRHKDRLALYGELFTIYLSGNVFSDRLSTLPPAFCRDLLTKIQPRLKHIGSPKKRKKVEDMLYKIIAEDASIFRLDNRLLDQFDQIPGCNSAGLKLFANVTVVGDPELHVKVKSSRHNDCLESGRKPKTRTHETSIEVRDRGFFSWKNCVKWVNDSRYFISRIKSTFNPQIKSVYEGDSVWVGKKFKDVDWSTYSGDRVQLEVKPYRCSKGRVYRLETGEVFTLKLVGKKRRDGHWYWYLYFLPAADLSFEDIHALYRARWILEEIFREIKQAFGGSSIRLQHPVCVMNHLLMMVLSYLICKGFLRKIASAHRRTERGFSLDICLSGTFRELFTKLVDAIVEDPLLTHTKLKSLSEAFFKGSFSKDRARSKRWSDLGKALKKIKDYEYGL